jgi:hypothetical protein
MCHPSGCFATTCFPAYQSLSTNRPVLATVLNEDGEYAKDLTKRQQTDSRSDVLYLVTVLGINVANENAVDRRRGV